MNDINVEEIMNEIRKDIRLKGKEDPFVDDKKELAFNHDVFSKEVQRANNTCKMDYFRPLSGNVIIVTVKKLVRKIISSAVMPCVNMQNEFNASVVKSMNQLKNYLDNELSMENRRLSRDEEIEYFRNHEKLIEQFENEVIALKLRIQELEQKLEVEDNQSQT